ncbi:hypothetical protein O6H91_07G023300 [Diphasiastrum complanatum]|uniref:Uncharacterized protein n=1 Tax=Diphasiastrum complanatum TaxID=34168 RepID=A0ACC2D380_DIPCM|nr:hypothetical protein O6H91_07G023300 [Diphasiastrum complanatum]
MLESMGSFLDCRELLLISGAAALGGTLVAAAFGAALLLSRTCKRCSRSSCNVCQAGGYAHFNAERERERETEYASASPWGERLSRRHTLILNPDHFKSREADDLMDEACSSRSSLSRPLLRASGKGIAEWISKSYANGSSEIFEDMGAIADGVEEPALLESFCFPKALKADPLDTAKRKGYLSWDDYFMSIAFLSAQRSKDPNRQVGACLVSQDQVILGIGYNGFPRGCSDDDLPWSKISADGDPLKTKYPYVCHAEVNAILNKNHASAAGQRLYVTMFPCNECAKIIIQAGIAEVIYYAAKGHTNKDGCSSRDASYAASWKLLAMAGIRVN